MSTTLRTPTVTNGVDIQRLTETVTTVQDRPALARFQFRATNQWLGGSRNQSTISDFEGLGKDDRLRQTPFQMLADEPPVLLGQDTGPNPVEFVLHALMACMTTSMVYHAAARGIRIDSLQTSIEGDLDLQGFLGLRADVRKGFEQIRIRFDVQTDATQEQLEQLSQFSPVFDIVSNPVPVAVTMKVHKD